MLQISYADFAGWFQRVLPGRPAVAGAVTVAASVGQAVFAPSRVQISRGMARARLGAVGRGSQLMAS